MASSCERCVRPGGCRTEPCRNPSYQPAGEPANATKMLRWSLMLESRSGPVDRCQPSHVTENAWRRIMEAYAHLLARAEAWDRPVPEPVQLPLVEDVSALHGTRIVHPAGVIPPEVEQAVTEQINAKAFAAFIATPPEGPAPTMNDLLNALDRIGHIRRPEPVKVTRQEWEALKASFPPAPARYGMGCEIGQLMGVPVEITDPAPPGLFARLRKRWLG